MKNYYKILEIPDYSDSNTIKRAYRSLSKKYHPDVNPDKSATAYFIVLKEAYEYLSDSERKAHLDTVLQRAQHIQIQKKEIPKQKKSNIQISTFEANTDTFSFNDTIGIRWNVENASRVFIDYIGEVHHKGTYRLKIDREIEVLEIKIIAKDSAGNSQSKKLILHYREKDPYLEAFRQYKKINPDTDKAHFRKEHPFLLLGRISKEVYAIRLTLSLLMIFVFFPLSVAIDSESFILITLSIIFSFIFANTTKRIQDLDQNPYKAFGLFIPFYQFYLVYRLLRQSGNKKVNKYGLRQTPKFISLKTAKMYYKGKLERYTLLTKVGFGFTVFTLLFPFLQLVLPTENKQVQIEEQGIYTGKRGKSTDTYYYLKFKDNLYIDVTQEQYRAIREGKYDTFVVHRNKISRGIVSVEIKSSKNTSVNEMIYFGLLNSSNPLLIILFIIFLFQLFAISQFNTDRYIGDLNKFMWFFIGLNLLVWFIYLL